MAHINSTQFGEITIDDKKYDQVLIIGNTVTEREYKKLKELFGTSHKIADWEIEALFGEKPEIIIIGTGQDGMLEVSNNFLEKAKEKGIRVITGFTPEMTSVYNEKVKEKKRINALFHTTC